MYEQFRLLIYSNLSGNRYRFSLRVNDHCRFLISCPFDGPLVAVGNHMLILTHDVEYL